MKQEAFSSLNRRIWLVSVAIALVTAGPVAIYVAAAPWLIAVPIIFGVLLIVTLDFTGKELLTARPGKLSAWISKWLSPGTTWLFTEVQAREIKEPVVDPGFLPKQPIAFIQPEATLFASIDSILAGVQRLVLTGKSGAGKTTCAVALCRRYEELNGTSPIKKIPVFIPLSQAKRSNGLSTMFMDRIVEQLEIDNRNSRPSNVKAMMKSGSLLLVIDDLDYLGKHDQEELRNFIARWQKNSFLCVISEIPSNSFLEKDFSKLEMPEWEPQIVRSYIDRRVKDADKRRRLIKSLEQGHTFEHSLLPWQASFLVDACLEGRFYTLLTLGGLESELDYKILDDFLRIVMQSADSGIEYRNRIAEFGGLALKLLKEGRSNFVPENVQISRQHLHGLIPKLFLEQNDNLVFVHGNYQVFLAGRYIAEFWPDAEPALHDGNAKALIWNAVYSCARQFIPKDKIISLDKAFDEIELK